MKLGILRAVGHNIADSLASGIGLMIGVYEVNVFAEASAEDEGVLVVDFLAGATSGTDVSVSFREAVELYRDALPILCAKHSIDQSEFGMLRVRYGTDAVYGPHFTVHLEDKAGRRAEDQYIGIPGKRLLGRRGAKRSRSNVRYSGRSAA